MLPACSSAKFTHAHSCTHAHTPAMQPRLACRFLNIAMFWALDWILPKKLEPTLMNFAKGGECVFAFIPSYTPCTNERDFGTIPHRCMHDGSSTHQTAAKLCPSHTVGCRRAGQRLHTRRAVVVHAGCYDGGTCTRQMHLFVRVHANQIFCCCTERRCGHNPFLRDNTSIFCHLQTLNFTPLTLFWP
jgi:hypothetical protein